MAARWDSCGEGRVLRVGREWGVGAGAGARNNCGGTAVGPWGRMVRGIVQVGQCSIVPADERRCKRSHSDTLESIGMG